MKHNFILCQQKQIYLRKLKSIKSLLKLKLHSLSMIFQIKSTLFAIGRLLVNSVRCIIWVNNLYNFVVIPTL